jgi:hypothetical protein
LEGPGATVRRRHPDDGLAIELLDKWLLGSLPTAKDGKVSAERFGDTPTETGNRDRRFLDRLAVPIEHDGG